MKVAVILNLHAGNNSTNEITPEKLRAAFQERDIDSKIFEIDPESLDKTITNLANSDVDAVAVAGGDGTLSSAAGILAGTGKPLAVIPGGTFNHFAKDLNIPLQWEEAVQVISNRNVQAIDVAEVNGTVFINNSSVGLYPKAVREREKYLHRLGGSKILAMIIASLSIFSRFPVFTIKLKAENEDLIRTTPFVFIGNNEYKLDMFNLGARKKITEGKLSLYTANCSKRLSVLRFAFKALINRIHQEKDFDLQIMREVILETRKRSVRVAVDGEVIRLEPPLHYKIRPQDLHVILPHQSEKEITD